MATKKKPVKKAVKKPAKRKPAKKKVVVEEVLEAVKPQLSGTSSGIDKKWNPVFRGRE